MFVIFNEKDKNANSTFFKHLQKNNRKNSNGLEIQ